MYLEKLETQGFKTFAQKTALEFLPPQGGKRGITAVVGPNGSGKSNFADAIRWSLGEQSLKLLRGKKGEDVIFSGTQKRARSGFAEVSLIFNNEDKSANIDYDRFTLTRRLYRDGNSEYLINEKQVRLSDIQLLLAQSNFGQRTYSVIGQGMVDHVLVASPQERKEFFDEAAGVKQFEIKRNQAVNKLQATHDNLVQAHNLLQEIAPRLRSLNRQVKRLEQREPLEKEMKMLGQAYYGTLWNELAEDIKKIRGRANEIEVRRTKKTQELNKLRKELEAMEVEETKATGFLDLQKEYETMMHKRNELREALLKIQNTIALAVMQQAAHGSFPVARVMRKLEGFISKIKSVQNVQEIETIHAELRALAKNANILLQDLRSGDGNKNQDPALAGKQQGIEKNIKELDSKLATLNERIANYAKEEKEQKGKFFSVQRGWEEKQAQLASIDQEANNVRVELARLETRREGLIHEIKLEMNGTPDEVLTGALPELTIPREEASERFRRIKTQLEMIGSIDPETIKEHEEARERHDFLFSQTQDLEKAITDLESAIEELDGIIQTRADDAFKIINHEFSTYFKQLFGGGEARLNKVETPEDPEEENVQEENAEEIVLQSKKRFKKKLSYSGVDIQATPPGKRLKSINALSGGERALTSIALICAIMASNPSPFVVLDEVDAALDESNSIRFAEIIENLSTRTQFILITHNRATMHIADILYGVTMGDDGVSQLLSLKLEEAEKIRND